MIELIESEKLLPKYIDLCVNSVLFLLSSTETTNAKTLN